MQKFFKFLLVVGLLSSLNLSATNVEVNALNGKKEPITLKVPLNPKRVATIDLAALDTIDALGVGDHVVAMPKSQKIEYLMKYVNNEKIINIGTAKEVDMEKLISSQPDVIFISGRLAPKYDELSKIAPVVHLEINYANGSLQSAKQNIATIAKIFGLDGKVDGIVSGFDKRMDAIKQKANGKSAIIGLVTSSSLHTLGNSGRCAMITTDAGFENLAKDVGSTHGNESSFELLVKLDPEYLFILDRDSAIAKPGAKIAKEVIDNELVKKTRAYKSDKIFYLTPAPWYLSEGGIHSMDIMLSDIEKALK
ncbi:ABC transporter substrate-binding protein [Campylobacter sp. faydin G-24]|uniref:ABC transporter substrate-binding protein n=1 Tax=Campylobacter anatolicus TaxID=2829105 RepID=A0ABS5HL51_9BACT|nr:ABC transporter substrate-binding protein [Campylobacter anatolicus]MBR8464472.1 ABC transporter substrate-binding protein [Campylobacter anatolicus]MBR8466315.1 ABC transporter substrate-binding protein [Campylobacter anatolicus]